LKNENVWCLTLSIAYCTWSLIINLSIRVIYFHFHALHRCHKWLVIATRIFDTKHFCTSKNLWCSNVYGNRSCYNNVFNNSIFDNKHLGTFTKIGAIGAITCTLFFMFSCQKLYWYRTFILYILMIMFLTYCENMCSNLKWI